MFLENSLFWTSQLKQHLFAVNVLFFYGFYFVDLAFIYFIP